ncbi:MAG: hypothetical protein WD738_02770 [Pirellulales bacterium]
MVTDRTYDVRQPTIGTRGRRTGLTTLEFVGCVTAVIGGAWLGAIYLGVDLRHLAHMVLAQAELLDKVPPEWRPPAPNQNVMTREQLVSTLRKELGSLRSELVALRTAAGENGGSERITDALALAKEKTHAYWMRLSEIALNETALQQDAESALNETNAAKVFAIKGRISRFAAKTVEAVPSENVDPTVIQFGEQLGEWYERAGALYERAVEIWESPATSQGRTQLNQEWRGADLQHHHEARLLNERAATVRGSLSRQYSEEFPEFAQPAAATPPAEAGETTASDG